jgi:tetratricopeptide (TPR) repeat protein
MAQESRDQIQLDQAGTDLLAEATIAADAGQVRHARMLLELLVRQEPDNERAWLELARLYERQATPANQRTRECLKNVLRINPSSRAARSMLRGLDRAEDSAPVAERARPARAARSPARHSGLDARGIYLVAACALVLIGALAVLTWAIPDSPLARATSTPTLTPTPQPTATPTATPTPSIPDRVAEQIPLLEQAWNQRDWQTAIGQLSRISALDARYPGLQAAQCNTFLHWAQELEQKCQIERAHELYRQAIPVCDSREDALESKSNAMLYLSGKWRYERERWPQAVQALQAVHEVQPEYAQGCTEPVADASAEPGPSALALDVHTLLHKSLVAASRQQLDRSELGNALQFAQRAIELSPKDQDVIELLNTINLKLNPPSAPAPRPGPATGKRIEVSISKQRMHVYQDQTLLYDWVVSTGKSGSGTAAGRFRVQSKIPEAWGGQWSLRMPYWLGIYWVGTIENGIHALPISANGTTLWDGYLGTPVSFGCIILSTENARTLYDWAEIGTPVWIYY